MRTVITTDVAEAAAFIKDGGIVAFPTETVYGLGANVFDEKAVAKIFAAKDRPADNPLIAHIASLDKVSVLAERITDAAAAFMEAFFPGPLTVVLPKAASVPLIATAGLDTIGVRMPSFDTAHRFLIECGTPVVAPSANLSGRPSPTTWQTVLEDLDGRIDCILKGEPTDIGLESTVVDCSGTTPEMLRKGAISLEQLRTVVPETIASGSDGSFRSPGLRHKHYSPKARVVLLDASDIRDASGAFIGISPAPTAAYAQVCSDIDEYARVLFEFFRECDRRRIETIYCEPVEERGIGAALMDRLRRAAE